MRTFWFVIYNILGVPFLWIFFRLYSLFNTKVREGFKGRRDLFSNLDKSLLHLSGNKNIIIHCSSLGEFQQAIPLAEECIKKKYNVVFTFFSPSGYNNSKLTFPGTIRSYIPFDSIAKQKELLDKIKPEIIIFMRYDLWYNLLYEAKKRGIKAVLANARYDEKDFTWKIPVIRSFKKSMYGMTDFAFVIDSYDETNYMEMLKGEDTKVIKIGDSKFERVYQSVKNFSAEKVLPLTVTNNKKIFVIGSSWKEDEEVIFPPLNEIVAADQNLLTLLVPHEPVEAKIAAVEKTIRNKYTNIRTLRYSLIKDFDNENLIIIDQVGILSRLYSIAYVSYIGGGFKTGLHNILEPAIFNMPVLFSNEVKNSDEDEVLIKYGCGLVINNSDEFYRVFTEILNNKLYRDKIGDKCKRVFKDSVGVAKKIIERITSNE